MKQGRSHCKYQTTSFVFVGAKVQNIFETPIIFGENMKNIQISLAIIVFF